ncbi:Rieske (2Fe-2S) protein [Chitinophaga horti]|uniref:Rieske (2Fe-2S) protein n=1 Tax=Chitinophaga horti TaxID=2920382 RepID=A0ABY6J6J4_9BACT|nr:Rieske (2Fe-2S) protein [Chitinophaga horti]UYQ95280.1 Rieske (2Fe-2S) protein [Chitinophaga horti]
MERRKFLSNVSLTIALACAGGLAACSKGGDNDDNPGGGGGGGNTNPKLTVNLANQLASPGDFIISGGIILIRIAAGNSAASFSALSSTCTHQGCALSTYNAGTSQIECNSPCGHGSRFSNTGAVVNGPATSALAKYTIEVNGTTLTVK